MYFSIEEKNIIIEILKVKKSKRINDIILCNDLFLEIIKRYQKEVDGFCLEKTDQKEYIFSGENSQKYLELIGYTFEKLIDNNLLKISTENINETFSILFFTNCEREINDFMVLKIRNKLNSNIYITPELENLFKWNPLKRVIIFTIFFVPIIIFFIFFLVFIKNLIFLIIFIGIIVIIAAKFYDNIKQIFYVFKYPFLDMKLIDSLLSFFAFIISIFSLFVAIAALKK